MPPLDETDTLEASLSAEFDKALAASGGDDPAPGPAVGADPAPAPADPNAAQADEEAAAAARARDEDGRFAKKAETGQIEPKVSADEAAAGPVEDPTNRPPHSLSPALKAAWSQLSPEVRQEFHRLEGSFGAAKNEWANKGQALNALDAVLAPVDQRLALQGLGRAQYVGTLVAADELMRSNPLEGLRQIAALYGVNLGQQAMGGAPGFGQQQSGYGPQPGQFGGQPTDPWAAQLQGQLAQLAQRIESRDQEDQQATLTRLSGDIQAFRDNPENTYFENVRGDMSRIIANGFAPDLPSAYRMACWARDDIRPLMLAAEAAKAAKATGKGGAASGVRAGAQINGGQPVGAQAPGGLAPGASIEETLSAVWDEVSGRA